jgi:hypothetical protein
LNHWHYQLAHLLIKGKGKHLGLGMLTFEKEGMLLDMDQLNLVMDMDPPIKLEMVQLKLG